MSAIYFGRQGGFKDHLRPGGYLPLYTYSVFHSPTFRERYAEFLKTDFPRLPLTSDKSLFESLAEKGEELVSLHLMESPALNNLITQYPVSGSNQVENPT